MESPHRKGIISHSKQLIIGIFYPSLTDGLLLMAPLIETVLQLDLFLHSLNRKTYRAD